MYYKYWYLKGRVELMKNKTWIKYLLYIILIVFAVYFKGFVEGIFQKDLGKNFRVDLYMLVSVAFITVMIGVALGVEHLMRQAKSEGIWKLNIPKFIFLGLPVLYLASIYITTFLFKSNILFTPIYNLLNSTSLITIFQILYGYIIITCFYKEKSIREGIDILDYETEETEEAEMNFN